MRKEEFSRVSVVGLGYIGLPTAAVMASRGIEIIGIDVNPMIVETINDGRIHIVEPGLDDLVHQVVRSGKLKAYIVPQKADVFLIAVPTPMRADHSPDLTYVEKAVRTIAPVLEKGNLVVLESTSPVGSTEQLAGWLQDMRPDLTFPQMTGDNADVNIAYCPERVLPGAVIRELVQNDRIIGGMTARCAERSRALYKSFVEGECIVSDSRTAEMTKLTENAFRDVNIAFANELSLICDRIGINVWELISLANRHPRVNILKPGPGVGGHCIAVDPWFIVSSAPEEAKLILQSRQVNDGKPRWVVDKVMDAIVRASAAKGDISVACLGLTFKANVDDLRESPALDIVAKLAGKISAPLLIVEPFVDALPKALAGYDNVMLSTLPDAIAKADVLVLLVDHDQFKPLTLADLAGKELVDTRGMVTARDGFGVGTHVFGSVAAKPVQDLKNEV